MQGAVAAEALPGLIGSQRPGVRFGEPIARGIRGLQRRELGTGIGVERGPERPGQMARAERPEDAHLSGLEPLSDPLGLLDQRLRAHLAAAVSHPPGIDLDGNQDLVLLGHLGTASD